VSKLTAGQSRRGKVRGVPASRSLHSALNNCDDVQLVDFVARCLDWDPATRITPPNALQHPWFKRRQGTAAEPILGRRPSVTLKRLAMHEAGDGISLPVHSKLPQI